MPNPRVLPFALVACVALAVPAGAAAAEVAYLRNGRTIDLAGYRLDGGRLVLAIAGGGEMILPVGEVLEIRRQPDDPATAAVAPEGAPSAPAPAPAAVAGAERAAPDAAEMREPAVPPAEGDGRTVLPVGGVFDRAALETMAASIAQRHGVDASLVHAVITIESRYDPFAVSRRGAMGLMQLMPKTAARFQVENAFDPVQNVDGGVRYLKELLDRYSGQVRLALAAYNAGEDAVERYSGIPPYRETVDYVRKVQHLSRR
jgi:soluble lytic murein transglycosylase-like protein